VARQDTRLTAADLVGLQQTLYASRNPTRRWLHAERRAWIEAALARAARAGGDVLEIGPGSGVYVPLLARLFAHVTVSDVEAAYLDAARGATPPGASVAFVTDDITRSRLPEAAFDVVLCTEVLEHVADSPAALSGIRRVLKPGGRLVLSTPQRWSTLEVCARIAFLPGVIRLVRLVYRERVLEAGHINLLTEREARRQVEAAGFAVEDDAKTGLYLPVLAEAGGEPVRRLEAWLARRIHPGPLDFLLWTQCYLARAV
jgi:ubiquinone/menaquinone biosynthesis C-methylase UbiE